MVCERDRADLPCGDGEVKLDGCLWYVEVVGEGEGNAARMSEIEPFFDALPDFSRVSLSLALSMSSMPIRLAVLPRSRLVASLVARLMSSGRLVLLLLGWPSFPPLRFSGGGRLKPFSFIDGDADRLGEAVPLEERAPPFSR